MSEHQSDINGGGNGGCVDHEARALAADAYGKSADMLVEVQGMRREVKDELATFRRMLRNRLASIPDMVEEELKTNPGLKQPSQSERAKALESTIRMVAERWIFRLAMGGAGALAVEWVWRWITRGH